MAIIRINKTAYAPKIPASEKQIQKWLYTDCSRRNIKLCIANAYIYDWESDFLQVTQSGYATEFEVKISRSDFKNDFTKTDKHLILQHGHRPQRSVYDRHFNNRPRPNYFVYITPWGLLNPSEIPAYAGLWEVNMERSGHRGAEIKVTKYPPKLHGNPQNLEFAIRKSTYYKYWKLFNESA